MPQLNFVKQGRGPVLVLSHPLGCDLRVWDEAATVLARHYTVLRYDHRGHGQSRRPPGPFTIETLADDAAALIEQQASGPVTFVGMVMGGLVGQQLAVRYPHLVSSIVMANTAIYFDNTVRARLLARVEMALQQGMQAVADDAMRRWFSDAFLSEPRNAVKVATMRATLEAMAAQDYVDYCKAMLEVDFASTNPLIACPALVIAGTQDDSIAVEAEALGRSISGAEMRTLDTGRMSAAEQPTQFAALVREFHQSL